MPKGKQPAKVHLLPKGRVINHSLFVKDQFNDKATPSYKIELAFEPKALDKFYEELLDFAVEKWGKGADAKDSGLVVPIKDGNIFAKKREAKVKPGDAYAGKEVIRANTIFNKHGEDGPGGVAVYDMDAETEIGIANGDEFYRGCYAQAAVVIGSYTDESTGNNGLTLYLSAVQKVADGEPLTAPRDHRTLFKPVGREQGDAPVTRAERVG